MDKPFATITYTQAVELLLKAKQKFEFPVSWGSDLQSEHERYLTETEFEGTPLIVTDYPKDIKVCPLLNRPPQLCVALRCARCGMFAKDGNGRAHDPATANPCSIIHSNFACRPSTCG